MSEDQNFDLFLAKEKRALSEAAYAEVIATADRTKGRASSLLGWGLTLTAASLAAATQSKRHAPEAYIAAGGFFATALLCANVLRSTPWVTKNLPPAGVDSVLNMEPACATEHDTHLRLALAVDAVNASNVEAVRKDQRLLRWAWRVAISTPIAASAAAAISAANSSGFTRQVLGLLVHS